MASQISDKSSVCLTAFQADNKDKKENTIVPHYWPLRGIHPEQKEPHHKEPGIGILLPYLDRNIFCRKYSDTFFSATSARESKMTANEKSIFQMLTWQRKVSLNRSVALIYW